MSLTVVLTRHASAVCVMLGLLASRVAPHYCCPHQRCPVQWTQPPTRVSLYTAALITSTPPRSHISRKHYQGLTGGRMEVRGLRGLGSGGRVTQSKMFAVKVSWESVRWSGDLPAGLVWCGLCNNTNTGTTLGFSHHHHHHHIHISTFNRQYILT